MTRPPQRLKRAAAIVAAVTLAALSVTTGCSDAAKPKISGAVTFNGEPVEQGEIRVAPVDGAGPTAAAVIAAGRYELTASPGAKRVEIRAYRQTGLVPSDPGIPGSRMVPVTKAYLPAKYNDASELTIDVAGDTVKDFALVGP